MKRNDTVYTFGKTHLFSFDVETDDLYGETFAFGLTVWDLRTKENVYTLGGFSELDAVTSPWCRENILPHLKETLSGDLIHISSRREMREIFWSHYMQWRDKSIILVDFQSPCEAGFMKQCVMDDLKEREWLGPYPMHDLGSMLAMLNLNPDLDRFKYSSCENLTKHNPIHDSITSAKVYFVLEGIMNHFLDISNEIQN